MTENAIVAGTGSLPQGFYVYLVVDEGLTAYPLRMVLPKLCMGGTQWLFIESLISSSSMRKETQKQKHLQ